MDIEKALAEIILLIAGQRSRDTLNNIVDIAPIIRKILKSMSLYYYEEGWNDKEANGE